MEEILIQLCGMVEGAISDEREVCLGIEQGGNTMIFSFIPVDYNTENGFGIMGNNMSLNISKEGIRYFYDPFEDEYIIVSGGTTYYFGII